LNEREKNRVTEKRLEVWESEGGAVPVAATRTTAQIRPKKPSPPSSSGVG
jgi:hypothetical protein